MAAAGATYEITTGGPVRRFERAIHLTRGGEHRDWLRRAVAIGAVVHVPLLVFGIGARLVTGEWPFVVREVSTHARALVAIPLLLFAQHLVDERARVFGDYLIRSGIAQPVEAYHAAVERSVRLRNSVVAEVALAALAIASMFASSTYLGARELVMWATFPAIVVFRFLLLHWVWRWVLWIAFLWRISRLPLVLRSTHPDRLAGLGPALGPSYAFAAVVAGCAAMATGGWIDQMLYAGHPVSTFYDVAIAFVVIAVVVSHAPGCVFIRVLYRARKSGLARYGAFAQRYVTAFDTRWMDARGESALGAPDISGLADLGGSYNVVPETRVLPGSRRLLQVIVAAALLPMTPLGLIAVGFMSLLERLGKVML